MRACVSTNNNCALPSLSSLSSLLPVRLHLLDYGEEYKVNLPNAYARSILTIPWLELGGKCHIECIQNGYSADVDFHCKVSWGGRDSSDDGFKLCPGWCLQPFYGGRKHRITCHVK